jgi:hypothetical protein
MEKALNVNKLYVAMESRSINGLVRAAKAQADKQPKASSPKPVTSVSCKGR